jgi:hypothetical protein
MKVRLNPPNAMDQLHLVKTELFMRVVDQVDLATRDSQQIENAFHEHWLSPLPDGSYLFRAPEFYLRDGVARFINGRHRTLVLAQSMSEIPMALTNMDLYPVHSVRPRQSSVDTLKRISVRQLSPGEVLAFPDLQIRYLGFDHNIGK